MPDIQLIKLTIRRGTDEQRKTVVLEQGEAGFTTDHKRLWIGDGVLAGGHVIGAKLHQPLDSDGARLALETAQTGDAVYENSWLYQLTGADYSNIEHWSDITTKPDLVYLQYDASRKMTLVNNSITGDKFAATAVYNKGGLSAHPTLGLSANPDNITVGLSASRLQVIDGSINESHINSSALYKGLSGGSYGKLQLSVNQTTFGWTGTVLELAAIPAGLVTYDSIDPTLFGDGLTYNAGNSTITANLSGVDSTLNNNAGVVGLKTIVGGGNTPWASVTTDAYGRVIGQTTTITRTLTGNDLSTPDQAHLSAFNGYPGQVSGGRVTGLPLTFITAASGVNTSDTITLSSAGFLAIDNVQSADGSTIDRIAIPVFNY